MFNFFLVLHVVSMSLVIGTLFLQSLTVVFRLRLKSADELIGIRKIQTRVHTFIYYPILAVTLFSGLYLAAQTKVFSKDQLWIYWKLLSLIILVGLGVLNGKQIQTDVLPKKYAMMVHIAIFIVGAFMIFLAISKAF